MVCTTSKLSLSGHKRSSRSLCKHDFVSQFESIVFSLTSQLYCSSSYYVLNVWPQMVNVLDSGCHK